MRSRLTLLAVLVVAGVAAEARGEGGFASPDGASRVDVTRAGRVTLVHGGLVHPLARMPWGPRLVLGTDVEPIGGRFERATWSADSSSVALSGRCRGYSGTTVPPVPRCASDFVRVVRVADPASPARLAFGWPEVADELSVLSVAFDDTAEHVAAIVRERWSDCSYEGVNVHVVAWRVADGRVVLRRTIATRDVAATVTFDGGGVRVTMRARSVALALGR